MKQLTLKLMELEMYEKKVKPKYELKPSSSTNENISTTSSPAYTGASKHLPTYDQHKVADPKKVRAYLTNPGRRLKKLTDKYTGSEGIDSEGFEG